jgi:hypothetical protein
MRAATAKKTRRKVIRVQKQVNVRVQAPLYRALEAVARQERRSVPQAARQLMEEGLRHHTGGRMPADDTATHEIASLAARGGAFDWLADEPDLYDDTAGEPI